MATRLRVNPAGTAAMLRSPRMVQAVKDRGERVADIARDISPVRTGRYKGINDTLGPGGFHVDSGVVGGKARARVSNPTPYAAYLEFGTRYMTARRILGRAAEMVRSS